MHTSSFNNLIPSVSLGVLGISVSVTIWESSRCESLWTSLFCKSAHYKFCKDSTCTDVCLLNLGIQHIRHCPADHYSPHMLRKCCYGACVCGVEIRGRCGNTSGEKCDSVAPSKWQTNLSTVCAAVIQWPGISVHVSLKPAWNWVKGMIKTAIPRSSSRSKEHVFGFFGFCFVLNNS